jgi:hypothetical protein
VNLASEVLVDEQGEGRGSPPWFNKRIKERRKGFKTISGGGIEVKIKEGLPLRTVELGGGSWNWSWSWRWG